MRNNLKEDIFTRAAAIISGSSDTELFSDDCPAKVLKSVSKPLASIDKTKTTVKIEKVSFSLYANPSPPSGFRFSPGQEYECAVFSVPFVGPTENMQYVFASKNDNPYFYRTERALVVSIPSQNVLTGNLLKRKR